MVNYTWDGLKVFTDTAHEAPASVAITGSSLNGVPIMTEEGVAVGSTREELIDAGAWALVDAEDPRTAGSSVWAGARPRDRVADSPRLRRDHLHAVLVRR